MRITCLLTNILAEGFKSRTQSSAHFFEWTHLSGITSCNSGIMAMMKLKLFLFMCYAVVTTVHSAGDSDTQPDGAFEGLTANGSDVGINMHPDSMIRYEIDRQSEVNSTVDETLIIEFSTDKKQGTLMSITNDDPSQKEFISVEMNNNGGVRASINVGFELDTVNTAIPNVDLTDNKRHVVVVRRSNKGRTLSIHVDEYPPAIKNWESLPDSQDTRLDHPRYIYFGRDESTPPGSGFQGCLYRAQFEDLYPLEKVFQNPQPVNIVIENPSASGERWCTSDVTMTTPDTMTTPVSHSPEVMSSFGIILLSVSLVTCVLQF